MTQRDALDERIAALTEEINRCGLTSPTITKLLRKGSAPMETHDRQLGGTTENTSASSWASTVATRIARDGGQERREISTGALDVPSLVLPFVVPIPWPVRLIDLFSNRIAAQSNAIEYYVESSRTNNATVVADYGTKPTSTFTVTPKTDHCRVVAHLSEQIPFRLLQDVDALQPWLVREMAQGVLAGLETHFVSGDGSGENMVGLFHTTGTTRVNFTTDPITTIRSAITQLQLLGEMPNGIALNPVDAQTIDLTRWGSAGGLLTGGFEHDTLNGFGTSNNIFGPTDQIRRVISPSVPQGFAIVADWNTAMLFVREAMTLSINYWGDALFSTNTYLMRAEIRAVAGFIRPQAFAIANLVSGS